MALQDHLVIFRYVRSYCQLEVHPEILIISATKCTHENLGGLCDEGGEQYGTLFGSLIGSNAGRATSVSGSVVLKPTTDAGSGKVTVWHQHGLYGVNGDAADSSSTGLDSLTATEGANTLIYGTDATGLLTDTASSNGDPVGMFIGAVIDSSLVSTTNAAAGAAAAVEYYAVDFCGNSVPPA